MPALGAGKRVVPVANGGTTYPGGKGKVPKATTPGSISPPPFTFDPAIAAKAREAAESESRQQQEIKTKEHFQQTDFHNALHVANTTDKRALQEAGQHFRRGEEDIGRTSGRGAEHIGIEEADTQKNARRQTEDFATQRANISRQFGELAHRQGEAQNASGTLDQGTSSAAAAARARNQAISEAPIATSESRLGEDLSTALGRYATARGQLGEDTSRELARLGEDTTTSKNQAAQNLDWETHVGKQKLAQEDFLLGHESENLKVANVNAQQNALEEEIYQAQEEHPAAFKKWSEENPSLLPEGITPKGLAGPGNPAAPTTKPKTPAVKLGNGGTTYAPNKKKRR